MQFSFVVFMVLWIVSGCAIGLLGRAMLRHSSDSFARALAMMIIAIAVIVLILCGSFVSRHLFQTYGCAIC